MSHKQVSLSSDLKQLRDEGYEIEIKNGHLLVHNIPLVDSKKNIGLGVLVCVLDLAGDVAVKPPDHTAYFAGEIPCDKEGKPLKGLLNSSERKKLADGVEVDHYFSAKPPAGSYANYHEKVSTYVKIIEAHAQAIDRSVTARTFKVIESTDSDIPFRYFDTNSSRAEIEAVSSKLYGLKIAIIGLGGTGAYVLDFVAKAPVKEIHLFDKDVFLSHNAFRAPGAATLEQLRLQDSKVSYLHGIYSQMHKSVVPHEYHLTEQTLGELAEMSFAFVCIDDGEAKKNIVGKLTELNIPFVDVGIGINEVDGSLTGSVRVTTVTPQKRDHVSERISFHTVEDDDYNKNIQIAELNALNAVLAVIKWKKYFGFYHDLGKEQHTVYDTSVNKLINDETIA